MPPHRRVLMITFQYPPSDTSSGGLRPLKFGKFLPEFGWESSVLTVPASAHESTDPALLKTIPPGVEVHRAYCFDAKAVLAVRGKYPAFIAVPDRYVSWIPFAVSAARRVIRAEGITAIYSTSPIPTAHLVARAVKRLTGIPWVADFRDPWVETEGSEVYGPFRQAIELWLERGVVRAADRVTVTTPELGAYLETRYGSIVGSKLRVVYNGYDEDDFEGLTIGGGADETFTLVHTGLLDASYRNPIPLLRAVRSELDRGTLPAATRVRFLGGGAFASSPALKQAIAELRLEATVEIAGRVPYREALAALAGAAALVLLQGGDDTNMLIPAKAFEYLRIGRLILAATPVRSATARLAQQFSGTCVADPADSGDLARSLATLAAAWRQGSRAFDRNREGLQRFGRRGVTGALAGVLDEVAGCAAT